MGKGEVTPTVTNRVGNKSFSSFFTDVLKSENDRSHFQKAKTVSTNYNHDQTLHNSPSIFESKDSFATNTMVDGRNNGGNSYHHQSNHVQPNHPTRVETNAEEQVSPVTRS